MQHPDKHKLQYASGKHSETLGTKVGSISVQPLQHMQYLDLLLQHTYETSETLETNACNMYFQMQHLLKRVASTTPPLNNHVPVPVPVPKTGT
jgi:hypothetical protein